MSEKLKQDHYKVKPKEHVAPKTSLNGEDLDGAAAASSYISGRGAQFNTKTGF
ncbi:MAG: hypothetical protein ABIO55_10280 [Ginsengibacter sp.]